MELNREQVVKALEKWMKNYDGKVTNFVTLGNAIGLIEKLDNENKRLEAELTRATECIWSVEDALNRGTDNDWAREAIEQYEMTSEGEWI